MWFIIATDVGARTPLIVDAPFDLKIVERTCIDQVFWTQDQVFWTQNHSLVSDGKFSNLNSNFRYQYSYDYLDMVFKG